jgi:hypothetical protein
MSERPLKQNIKKENYTVKLNNCLGVGSNLELLSEFYNTLIMKDLKI